MNTLDMRLTLPALLLASAPAAAQNLIADGSLELGTISACSQGQTPDTWYNVVSTADTYTYDCANFPGLTVSSYAHFAGLPAAHDGVRFVAGWSDANEVFGTTLTQPLTPGSWYDVRAFFSRSFTLAGDGSYVIWLNTLPTLTGAVAVAEIGSNDVQGVWTEDLAHFQSPGAFTHMILQPIGNGYYTGSDSWSIEEVDGPQPFCEAAVNSTGSGAHMGFVGSVDIAMNQFNLVAYDLPANVWGQFCYGTTQMQAPFGNGFRCVGAGHRLPPLARSDANGDASLSVDLTYGAIAIDALPGTELHFQFWYRDRNGGGVGFNLTDGITVRMQ